MNSWPKGVYLQSITHAFPTQYRFICILIQSCFVDQQSVGPLISYCDHFGLSTYQLRGQDLGHKYILLTKREVNMAGYWPSYLFAFLWTELAWPIKELLFSIPGLHVALCFYFVVCRFLF